MQTSIHSMSIQQHNLQVAAVACAAASYFYAYWFSQGLA